MLWAQIRAGTMRSVPREEAMKMTVGRFAVKFGYSLVSALVFLGVSPVGALAQDGHSHATASQQQMSPEQKSRAGALVQAVREATARFQNPTSAEGEKYFLNFGCVSGGDFGAMGLHFINMDFVKDGQINVNEPEIILYEPLPNGKFRLTGADYLVDAEQWDAANPGPPELMGQLFHLFDAPNRFGLKAFYTLHVWAWKDNPNGTFTNWNPNVSCDAFTPPTP
jgi:hypothetical protein